ncbi:hypothetical protein Pmar_PMAR018622 [Perkinsus marinus ATCC 50983]|uniref:Uncharacterized protein n=1 Tax=Perkinsus marinus (strain ATCC 50983 / TXsc) TaxID=423536 RepID=C5L0B9_PERM5|nr:hypothetical protein Pmar_PMAR018622 [Perkinsus marinus ATCC 50983]EER09977.1 hypothetical protein Pmar_PMAR018622 [Perkinsus marinus ATCC 50983]|eukprot:XP_002778182.1 hypothetical protein Pmar_PMAR018622 [Perkinsus marinus ATCC 50983]
MPSTPPHEPRSGDNLSDDPLGEASFTPQHVICVNPLCRRKWKQLTPKSIPMFCPSCKKASELGLWETWEGVVTDDTFYYNLLKYWYAIYTDIASTLGYAKSTDLNLPQDPTDVTIVNVMDFYYEAFPEHPVPEDVRNWSSMGQRKKQLTGTIIRQCGGLQRHHDMAGRRFYIIDWRGALKIGDHVQFVAFPNPSVDERNKLPHVIKVLDDRVNPPHHRADQGWEAARRYPGEQPQPQVLTSNGTHKKSFDPLYTSAAPSHRDQRQSESGPRGFPQCLSSGLQDNRRPFGGNSNGNATGLNQMASTTDQLHSKSGPARNTVVSSGGHPLRRKSKDTNMRPPADRVTAASASTNGKSPADQMESKFPPMVGSMVAPLPGFDDTNAAWSELARLLSVAANKEVPRTPQAPTLEPKIPEWTTVRAPAPSPALPARPDWIPDTPASPLYLHRDMNFRQAPNPLVQFLQMQAAAGAASQVPSAPPLPYGSGQGDSNSMVSPFTPTGGVPPVSAAAAVGLDGDLAGLAAWGASWPSSGMMKRHSTSQPPTPIQEETTLYGLRDEGTTTTESTVPRGEGRARSPSSDDVVLRPSTRHTRRRSRSRDAGVSRRRSSTEEDDYRRRDKDDYRRRNDDDYRRRDDDDYRRRNDDDYRRRDDDDYRRRDTADHRSRRREDRSDRPAGGGGGSYYDVRSSRDPPDGSSSLHYVNSSSRGSGQDAPRPAKQDETRGRIVDDQALRPREDSLSRHPKPSSQHDPPEDSPDSLPREAKARSVVPPRKGKPVVQFGKAMRPDPRAAADRGNVLELSCDCPRKYVSHVRPLRDPAWLPTVKWGEATFEEHILLKREFAPRAVANARGQATVPPPTVAYGTAVDGSWHETWPSDVDCRIICVLRLPDLVTSDETFLRAAREAIPCHLRARDALQKAVVVRASGLGGSVIPAKCGYLAFRTRRDARECWSLQHLKLYGYICPLITDPTAFRILCQVALVLKLYEGHSIGATTSITTPRLVPESGPSTAPVPSTQVGFTSTKFGGGLSSRKPLSGAVRGADVSNGAAGGSTSRGRFVLRGLKESLQRLKGPPVESCGNFSAAAVRYSRLDQRDGAVVGRSEYVRAETSSDGQSQKLNIGLTNDRNVVVLETNDDSTLVDWRPEWVFRDWAWGCRPISVSLAEKKSAFGEIDPAELSDYSTYSVPDMSVFKPVRSVPLIGGVSPQSKARSAATSRKGKKSKKDKKKKRKTSHELTAKLAAEVKADGSAATKAGERMQVES